MCGRARCTLRPDSIPKASHRHSVPSRFLHLDRYRPSYNIAPGSYMPVLRKDNEVVGDGVVVHCMKWGLVPSFTNKTDKPDFFKMFNARSESVSEKASFRRLLPKDRCLVVVDGFYEWKKEGSKKQPYYIHFKDGRPLVFAALFDSWVNSEGETLYTFTILTTASSSALHWLHDRMPVILGEKDSVDTWLDDPTTTKLQPLLTPYEKSDLVWYPVTSAMGKTTFDGPECIQQIPLKTSQNSLISKFFSAKQDKGDKETIPADANISVDLKREPKVEGCEEIDEEKDISDDAKCPVFEDVVKEEPGSEDSNRAVASHLESVKNEVEEGTNGEDKAVKTNLTKETGGESNADLPKEEPENQDETIQDKPGNENEKTDSTCQTTKNGTKRDYGILLSQEKPLKHTERSQDVKSFGKSGRKQGKGKFDTKKMKETQSTLHFFFDEK